MIQKFKIISLLVLGINIPSHVMAGDIQDYVSTNLAHSKIIFDRQAHLAEKPLQQLLHRQKQELETGKIYLGGRLIATRMYERTNVNGKFPILSRLPQQHTVKSSAYESAIHDFSLNITATPLSWLTLFAQGEQTEVEYPGQNERQLRQYRVIFGDLSKIPFYLSFGRGSVAFGNFDSYAPFTHSHSSHYFWPQSDNPHFELGYFQDDLHFAFSVIPSNRGLRVLNTPDNSGYDNFAVNLKKKFSLSTQSSLLVGAGYLKGSIYDSTFAHHPPAWNGNDNRFNGAWDVFGTLTYGKVDINAEFTKTENTWPATNFPVSAITLQGRYRHKVFGKESVASLMYSKGIQGEKGTQWEKMDQIILGYETEIHPSVSLGVEYIHNRGFVPLIMPTRTGNRSVESDTIMLGTKITF